MGEGGGGRGRCWERRGVGVRLWLRLLAPLIALLHRG